MRENRQAFKLIFLNYSHIHTNLTSAKTILPTIQKMKNNRKALRKNQRSASNPRMISSSCL